MLNFEKWEGLLIERRCLLEGGKLIGEFTVCVFEILVGSFPVSRGFSLGNSLLTSL